MYFTRGGSEYRCIDNQFWPYVPLHIPAVEDGWKAMFEGIARYRESFSGGSALRGGLYRSVRSLSNAVT